MGEKNMDSLFSLVIENGGERIVVTATKESKFEAISSRVCGKWPIFNSKSFSLKYSIAGIDNCCLDNDNDVVNMLILASQLFTVIIHVKLVCLDECTIIGDNCGTERVIRSDPSCAQNPNLNPIASAFGETEILNNPLKRKVPANEKANDCPTVDVCPPHEDLDECTVIGDNCGTEKEVRSGPSCAQHPNLNPSASAFGATEMPSNPLKRKVPANEKANDCPTVDACPPHEDKPLLSDTWTATITGIGQEFPGGANEFRQSLIKYSAVHGFKYIFQQNGKRRIYVVCNKQFDSEACKWFIRASECSGGCGEFVIKDADLNHQCETIVGARITERLGADFLGNLIEGDLRDHPEMGGKDVKKLIKNAYGLDISYKQAWRALEVARDKY